MEEWLTYAISFHSPSRFEFYKIRPITLMGVYIHLQSEATAPHFPENAFYTYYIKHLSSLSFLLTESKVDYPRSITFSRFYVTCM